MKKRLDQWVKEHEHIKISLNYHKPGSILPETMAGFLMGYDEIGLSISHSPTKKMVVLIPWNNILCIELWGDR